MKKLSTIITVMAMGAAAVFADAKGTEIMTRVHDVKKDWYIFYFISCYGVF